MPWRRIAIRPVARPSSAAQAVAKRIANSGGKPHALAAYAAAYPAVPRNMACPKDSSPPKPISRLKAQANSAKHIAFMRKIGYSTSGASRKNAAMAPSAIFWERGMLLLCPEQACGPDHQHDGHDDEDHRVRRLGIE